MPVFYLPLHSCLKPETNMKWLYPQILQTQIPMSIVNSEGKGKAAQIMVVLEYVIVRCQKYCLAF